MVPIVTRTLRTARVFRVLVKTTEKVKEHVARIVKHSYLNKQSPWQRS